MSTATTCPLSPGSTVLLQVCVNTVTAFCNLCHAEQSLSIRTSVLSVICLSLQVLATCFPGAHGQYCPYCSLYPSFYPRLESGICLVGTEVCEELGTYGLRPKKQILMKHCRNLGVTSPHYQAGPTGYSYGPSMCSERCTLVLPVIHSLSLWHACFWTCLLFFFFYIYHFLSRVVADACQTGCKRPSIVCQ